jgi:Domain of unknown function (DUF1707)
MRAADVDREKVADELRIHCVDGRITLEELDQRLQGVMSALTIRELAEFVCDLPTIVVRSERDLAESRVRVGPPGVLPFTRRFVVPASLERTQDVTLDTIAPALNSHGYELISQSAGGLVFERRSSRTGADRDLVRGPRSEQDNMTVHGTASRNVRKAFAQLTFS